MPTELLIISGLLCLLRRQYSSASAELTFQQRPQRLAGTVQTDLHCVLRNAQKIGNLCSVEILDVARQKHGTIGLGQPVDTAPHQLPSLTCFEHIVGALVVGHATDPFTTL